MKSENQSLYILAPLLISFILLLGAKPINAQEVENEREFDYGKDSAKGPGKWGEIKKEWAACSSGTLQSPIDMSNERVGILSKPENRAYKAANAIVKNRGHDIQVEWSGGAGSLFINGTEYPLRYAHWHSPSEHTINGRRFDMELHLVHITTAPNVKNTIAVVGTLYQIGEADHFLTKLMKSITSIIDKHNEEVAVGMVDPNEIELGSQVYYRYIGSLTVPPCTEGVIWTINRKVKTVSTEQVKLLREAVHDFAEENARPMQLPHNREIYLYEEGPPS